MANFSERLDELLFENNLTSDMLGKKLGISGGNIRCWKLGKRKPLLFSAIKLANFFNCSLEFLVGRTETKLDYIPQPYLSFYERLRQIMKQQGVTLYRLVEKDKIISDTKLYSWKNGGEPFLQSIVDLADYFKCSVDYLVGLEQ